MSGLPVKTAETEARKNLDKSEREFTYFKPRGRRATMYEDVTCDTQPSVQRHLSRGWLVQFEDGRPGWDLEGSRVRMDDWYGFRDPGGLWERPYYQRGTQSEREIVHAVQSARDDGLFSHFDPAWTSFLREHGMVPAFVDHGLWLATASSARACLSDSITHCMVFEAAMKQRQAQAFVLMSMDYETELGDFSMARAKESWLRAEPWQGAREVVERMMTIRDWVEVLAAVNLCFEPLVGVLVRREMLLRPALAGHDPVTPVLARNAQLEWEWTRDWTLELVRFLTTDEKHGEANREALSDWVATWGDYARTAAEAIVPLLDGLPGGGSGEQALKSVLDGQRAMLELAGLTDDEKVATA
jgi:propane monooxygenase small subunit